VDEGVECWGNKILEKKRLITQQKKENRQRLWTRNLRKRNLKCPLMGKGG